jgi:tol-pal system protein YbgF
MFVKQGTQRKGSDPFFSGDVMPLRNVLFPVALAAIMTACSSLTPTEDPVYLKMTDLEARVIRIERVVENQSLTQIVSQLEQLRAETASLRGEIETLRYETENSDSRQRELYVDVDRRLQTLEQQQGAALAPPPAQGGGFAATQSGGFAPAAPSESPAVVAAPVPPVRASGTDQQNYQAAFELIQARRYEEAGAAFTQFLASFPTSPLADNAQYWLAETHYVQNEFTEALPAFQKVVNDYPQSAKLPDALLKVGYCQQQLGNRDAARTALQQVLRQYPDTTAARLASQRLERL